MDESFYINRLYPLQDKILGQITALKIGFYLTGGTAASRGYLNHRFSDDLDLFVNDDDHFGLWSQRIIQALANNNDFAVNVLMIEDRFVRLNIEQDDLMLKIEMINDVPAHVGEIKQHPVLGYLDSAENILANKVTALIGREEPKDLADIWGFCCQMDISLSDAIENAHSKAAGIFPADLARVLCSVTRNDWQVIQWIDAPNAEEFILNLRNLGESLILY
ncbi:MAG: nucleotidyl transferase AbiEii/AbiGii toxin family protein [Anaerolineae bacterium]|nr:nucleotidyl transferase AbiEii/AbiGii toxin family protein [Anaerolineae bacterium]